MPSDDFTSLYLLRAARDGDAIAEGVLVDRYVSRLLAVAANRLPSEIRVRIDPEDIVQSACRVFINRVREGEVVVRQRGDLWNQLLSVTLNKIRSSVRKHRRKKRNVGAEQPTCEEDLLSREPTPDEALHLVETIHEILSGLPKEAQRKVVLLRLQGYSTSEIASSVELSVERVRQILRWVRNLLEPPATSQDEC